MHRDLSITVVIPTYNEEKAIAEVIQEIPNYVDEILVIDSSSDNTPKIAKELGARVVNEPRRGYGRAHKTGLENASSNIIVTLDGDMTYPANEISAVIDYVLDEDLDFVSCSRFPLKEKKSMKLFNTMGNKFISLAGNILFKQNISDLLSGMWLLRKDIVPKLNLVSDNWDFSEEIKLEAACNPQIRFSEYHINYRPRLGPTKMPAIKTGFENIVFLFKKRLDKH